MNNCERAGFAYLWTLMLVALLGAGLALGSHMHHTSMQREKEEQLIFIGHQFRAAIASYLAASPDKDRPQYPASLEDLLKDPRFPGTVRHLRRIWRDPITGRAEWGLIKLQGRIVGVHSLSEAMPLKQDHFRPEDSMLAHQSKYSGWRFTWPENMLLPAPPAANPNQKPS
ncbi:type II secretion system protein [Massilia sp. W12]|uniref:type II secretion system protein n=1 Tax=Massilia sp. W12 TaxID=3126507 RepID=UPI0030D4162E